MEAVLEQEGRPLGFLSKKMSPAEMRYAAYDQELLALIRALEKWRRLLLTADVTAYTDHRALQYLLKLKADKFIRGRVARWFIFLSDFQNLKIVYQPGAGNVVADALSPCPTHKGATEKNTTKRRAAELGSQQIEFDVAKDLMLLREVGLEPEARQGAYYKRLTPVTEYQQVPLWKLRVGGHRWRETLVKCEDFGEAYNHAKETPGQVTRAEVKGVFRDCNVACHVFTKLQGLWKICVPSDRMCRQYVMYQRHDHPTAGHMGVGKTYDALARQFYWPGIQPYASTYVESYPTCRAANHVSMKPGGLLQSLQIPSRKRAQASMDFITGLPVTTKQHDATLSLVDTVSKMTHFIPAETTVTAEGVVSLLADKLARYHGLPRVIASGCDPRFVSELWELFALSSAWHSQADR